MPHRPSRGRTFAPLVASLTLGVVATFAARGRADDVTPAPVPSTSSSLPPPTNPPSQPSPPPGLDNPVTPSTGDFSFGSYGRVVSASDMRGGSGRQANIVAHGTRIDESTYAELQLERRDHYVSPYGDVTAHVVATLGIAGPLFHETDDFSVKMAVRNLYAEATGMFFRGFSAWVGSRMYRGDDVYLLDFWPLDNLNTVGGGMRLAFDTTSKQATSIAVHAGLNRPLDPFQFETRPSTAPNGFGATDVVVLDRPRLIVSSKLTHLEFLNHQGTGAGFKAVLYGEAHSISRGTSLDDNDQRTTLPPESGTVGGAQLGYFTGKRDTFVNLFFRYATGIAAYGDKTVPTALSPDKSAAGAHELLLALSANYERGPFAVLFGGYLRAFRDASGNAFSRNTYNEGIAVVRPQVWLFTHLGIAAEASYQALSSAGVDDSGNRIRGHEVRFGFMPFLTPAGWGSFTRPHLRIIYAYTIRDSGARALYAPEDRFAHRSNEHFLGLGVEWWFNSSYR